MDMAVAGRPRTFDKEDALKKAMHVFWEKGFEGTTMADLIEAIGMKAPSIYAAFGNKDAMFKEVVLQYMPIVINGQLAVLNSTPNIYEAVEKTLEECVRLFSGESNPHACLILTAAINACPEHQEHVNFLRNLRKDYKKNWLERFVRAKKEGQLKTDLEANALAEYFMTIIQGMALLSKDGTTKDCLTSTAKIALQVLA